MLLNVVISMNIGLCYICVDGHWCAVSYGFISMGTTNNFDGSLLRVIEYFAIKRGKKRKNDVEITWIRDLYRSTYH